MPRRRHETPQNEPKRQPKSFPTGGQGPQKKLSSTPHERRMEALGHMACFHPLKAWKQPGGGITFNQGDGWSDLPVDIPCYKCKGCRIERSKQWAMRCVHEKQLHDVSSFITLTYNNENLPRDGSLDLTHWQKFAKRLRNQIGPFRFFHCGEYGDENWRPHYHACIFGLDFYEDRVYLETKRGNKLYTSPTLTQIWGKGFTTVGNLTYESAAYVARYIMKKVDGKKAEEEGTYQRVNPETGEIYYIKPPYITMSRNPGIGSDWFAKFKGDVYPHDEVIIDGRRHRPPRYYDEKLPEEERQLYKGKRAKAIKTRKNDLTPDRLAVREKVLENKLKELRRKI